MKILICINKLIELVKLSNLIDDKVKTYSLGMKQRLGIEPLTFSHQQLITPYNARLTIISIIITIVLCGGVVANEHKNGTIRLLLTKPYKRYKILK